MNGPKKIVLAYSGGLDTSVILAWLKETYGAEIVAYTADLGQAEELIPVREKALRTGASSVHIVDLREEFVRDFVFPVLRANATYEAGYLLGTSFARPLIAKGQVAVARAEGADAVAHGATGKGNDQVRFELTYAALAPDLRIVAPWRDWDLRSRTDLMAYAERHGIPVPTTPGPAVLHGPEPLPHLLRGRDPRGPVGRAAGEDVPADPVSRGSPRRADPRRDRVRGRQPRRRRRPAARPGRAPRAAQPHRRRERRRPHRPGGEPLRRDEVARRLRDARAAPSSTRRTGRSSPSRWTGSSSTSATRWCPATPRWSTTASGTPPSARRSRSSWTTRSATSPARAAQALQGQRHGGRAPLAALALPPGRGDLRGRLGVPPEGRRGLHPPERAPPPHPRPPRPGSTRRPVRDRRRAHARGGARDPARRRDRGRPRRGAGLHDDRRRARRRGAGRRAGRHPRRGPRAPPDGGMAWARPRSAASGAARRRRASTTATPRPSTRPTASAAARSSSRRRTAPGPSSPWRARAGSRSAASSTPRRSSAGRRRSRATSSWSARESAAASAWKTRSAPGSSSPGSRAQDRRADGRGPRGAGSLGALRERPRRHAGRRRVGPGPGGAGARRRPPSLRRSRRPRGGPGAPRRRPGSSLR